MTAARPDLINLIRRDMRLHGTRFISIEFGGSASLAAALLAPLVDTTLIRLPAGWAEGALRLGASPSLESL